MGITGITNLMVGESLQIIKDKFMKGNGKMELSKEKDFGKVQEVKIIWVNGSMENLMVMEYSFFKMVIDTKGNSRMH